MGDIVQTADGEVELAVDILAAAPIERVDIFNGLEHLETVRPYGVNDLGNRIRVIWEGAPEPNTGSPGGVLGRTLDRVLRAPVEGVVGGLEPVGARLEAGQPVARVGDQAVVAPFDGVLRGLVHDGLHVAAGMKIGDVDPRAAPEYCFTISDKALAIGGGVLEAILSSPAIRERL